MHEAAQDDTAMQASGGRLLPKPQNSAATCSRAAAELLEAARFRHGRDE
jgi:hypothetical protein